MEASRLRVRHQLRGQPQWLLLAAAIASLAMLVLASMLTDPSAALLR